MFAIKLNGQLVRVVPELVEVATRKGYSIEPYEPPAPPEPTPEDLAIQEIERRRIRRTAALQPILDLLSRHRNQADYGLPTTLTQEQAAAWAVYAQALRDYPETGVWPKAPEEVV